MNNKQRSSNPASKQYASKGKKKGAGKGKKFQEEEEE